MVKTLFWRDFGGSVTCRPSSALLRGPNAFPLHRHDFPEVFWITQGFGTHQINGESRPLAPGVIVMIRPADGHAFRSDAQGVIVQNIAIKPGVLTHVKRRYFPHDDAFWNGPKAAIPPHRELNPDQLGRLQAMFDELGSGPWNTFATERFLLNLVHAIRPANEVATATRTPRPPMPDWLATGLARCRGEVKHFGRGTPALAQLAGRSPEHVARTLRECTGRTPTDCLNEMRMSHAAQQLAVTNRKILDIAMECGFDSLGHFYALFYKAQGCSPRAYRMRFQPRPI